ncbi:MAG TPA: type II secretion system protein [Solirubrobacterales bacterium]|nr:type II secretion system protein [Solirubrobacterales bacterium]
MAPARNREGGFTIIEVLVALMILAMASITTFTLLSSATRNAQRAKASQVALEFAEQELELLRSMEDKNLALTFNPPHVDKPLNPDYRVSGGKFALSRSPLENYKNLVYNTGEIYGGGEITGGTVSPGPTSFTNGDVSGKVYRYIVWRNDPKCSEEKCPGKQDYKQIIVAVKLDTTSTQPGERGYFEVQSNFVNPTDNSEHDPMPGAGGSVITAQQFFLSDTPCSGSGITARQEISGNHLLHNTLGTCASGMQNGTTIGAPDAMVLGAPPDPAPEDLSNPPEYDYSSDEYLNLTPHTDTGLQLRKPESATGCIYEPTGKTYPQAEVHRWVTDPMLENFVMTGKATLQFYTGALGTSTAGGKICVYLYKRHEEGTLPKDTPLTNTNGGTPYWTWSPAGNWPQEWTKVRLTMNFNSAPYTIPAGDRLLVAVSLEAASTVANGVSFMYDHPTYLTRLEVETSTPINGG